jgi:ATP-dependent Lon protease
VLFPAGNQRDLADIPDEIRKKMKMQPVMHMDEVLSMSIEGLAAGKKRKTKK